MPSFKAPVSTTPVMILPANPRRRWATFVNTGSNDVTLSFDGQPDFGAGIYLVSSGGSYAMDATNLDQRMLQAVSTGTGTNLAVAEG